MATLAATSSVSSSLHPRLVTFFARYPPRLYGVHFTGEKIPTIQEKIAREGNKKTGAPPTNGNRSASTLQTSTASLATTSITSSLQSSASESDPASLDTTSTTSPLVDPETSEPIFSSEDQPPNPFLPYRNPATGHWRGPTVSLRRQAELFKLARVYGVEPLLPASRKSTIFKESRLLERGLAVKGTGVGQKVKGHKWERAMGPILEKRIEAMEKMPDLIREWRMRGNGRRWKRYPK